MLKSDADCIVRCRKFDEPILPRNNLVYDYIRVTVPKPTQVDKGKNPEALE